MMLTKVARLKGLIYIAGDAGISIDQLGALLHLSRSRVKKMLTQINQDYSKDDNDPCQLLEIHGKVQMVTKKALNPDVQKFLKDRHTSILTSAALETLTIIAYNQPVTRIEVDNIRGVNSAITIQKLLNQKLIQTCGRKKVLGNPIMYKTTDAFLNLFGLQSIKQLPTISRK